MTERPIPFTGAMVKALLDGRKSQTRRIFKSIEPIADDEFHIFNRHGGLYGVQEADVPREALEYISYEVGDRLWVKEAWRTVGVYDDLKPSDMGGDEPLRYEADEQIETRGWPVPRAWGRYRAGRFMPRWASRITLEVTSLKVERLQDISEMDARREGLEVQHRLMPEYRGAEHLPWRQEWPRDAFNDLWEDINGPGSWDANPWVVVIAFKRVEP